MLRFSKLMSMHQIRMRCLDSLEKDETDTIGLHWVTFDKKSGGQPILQLFV